MLPVLTLKKSSTFDVTASSLVIMFRSTEQPKKDIGDSPPKILNNKTKKNQCPPKKIFSYLPQNCCCIIFLWSLMKILSRVYNRNFSSIFSKIDQVIVKYG